MLLNLHVKNLALIDEADVEFGEGLHVLSGETGAGKSILIGSMNLALGEKVPRDVIRSHADYAYVEMVFQIEEDKLPFLEEEGIFPEDGLLIISRKILPGRSVSRINGETVPVSKLRRLTSRLMDIHGQHEHQSLLYRSRHLEILDMFGGTQIREQKKLVSESYRKLEVLKKEIARFSMDEEQRRRELSFIEFEIQELEEASLVSGEEEELTASYRKLLHSRELAEGLAQVCAAVSGEGGSASESLGSALHAMQHVIQYDKEGLAPLLQQLYDIESLLADVSRDAGDYLENIDVEEEALDQLQKRLDLIHAMKSKYGGSVDAALEYLKEQRERLEELRNYEACRAQLLAESDSVEKHLNLLCQELRRLRGAAAKPLAEQICVHLKDLNFLNVEFEIALTQLAEATAGGTDEAEFMISLNPGEKLRPLGQVASGGELSRIMLALKTVLAEKDDIPTLVFDEIDAGISGRTAGKVGEKLRQIGRSHQVICISHLPQIVAMADCHYLIRKQAEKDSAKTMIQKLDREESVTELARLIGGVSITETTIQSAREMKELAEATK